MCICMYGMYMYEEDVVRQAILEYIHAYIHTYIHAYTGEGGRSLTSHSCCIHTYIHAYIHTYIHTYMDIQEEEDAVRQAILAAHKYTKEMHLKFRRRPKCESEMSCMYVFMYVSLYIHV
jgi:hypothetical protein